MSRTKDLPIDTRGRPYALVGTLKAGSTIVCDDGFTCLLPWREIVVRETDRELWIPCRYGHHYLEGQTSGPMKKRYYIGIYSSKEEKSGV